MRRSRPLRSIDLNPQRFIPLAASGAPDSRHDIAHNVWHTSASGPEDAKQTRGATRSEAEAKRSPKARGPFPAVKLRRTTFLSGVACRGQSATARAEIHLQVSFCLPPGVPYRRPGREAPGGMALGGTNIGYENGSWGGTLEGNAVEQALGGAGMNTGGFELTDMSYNASEGWTGAFSNEFGTVNQDGQYSAAVIPDDGDESTTWPAVQEAAGNVKTTISDIWTSIFGGEKPAEQQEVVENTGEAVVPEGEQPVAETPSEQPTANKKESPIDVALLKEAFEITWQPDGTIAAVNVIGSKSRCGVLKPGKVPRATVRCYDGPNFLFEADLYTGPGGAFDNRAGVYRKQVVQTQLRLPVVGTNTLQAIKDGDIVQMDAKGRFGLIPAAQAGKILGNKGDLALFVPGMNNHELDLLGNLKATSQALGMPTAVYGVYVARVGMNEADRIRGESHAPASLGTVEELLRQGRVRDLIGYSLGGAITARALKNVQAHTNIRNVRWVTVTGAQTRANLPVLEEENAPGKVVMIAGKNDKINGGHLEGPDFVCNRPIDELPLVMGCDKPMYDYVRGHPELVRFIHEDVKCVDPQRHSYIACYVDDDRFLKRLRKEGIIE